MYDVLYIALSLYLIFRFYTEPSLQYIDLALLITVILLFLRGLHYAN